MGTYTKVLDIIEEKNPRHGKSIRKNMSVFGEPYLKEADIFYEKYIKFANACGKTLEYGVDSYLRLVNDQIYDTIDFHRTGEYACKSFEDAYKNVYSNPEVMEYYMHGLLMSQMLWKQHYSTLKFFGQALFSLRGEINGKYLEIGGGHGLFIENAIQLFEESMSYSMLDISDSSIKLAKEFLDGQDVEFILGDAYVYDPEFKYDFITMGEVLEHVERPLELLQKINYLLSDRGYAFITAPTNAPAIDHIYLFESRNDITDMIHKSGFSVVKEAQFYVEDVIDDEDAKKRKVASLYAALIQKN